MARKGRSAEPRADAALNFALKINEQRGKVSDADVQTLKAAGFSDAQVVEIIAVVAENIFTNLLNIAAGTEIDFPLVLAAEAA